MKYFLLILLFGMLFACSDNDENIIFKTSQKKFNLSIEANHMVSGLFGDTSKRSECYYFSDLVTAKKIEVCGADLKLKLSIDLKDLIHAMGDVEIQDVAFLNKDSILLFAESINTVYLIDSKGKLLKTLEINNFRHDFRFEIFSTIYSHFYDPSSKSMIFAQSWSNFNPIARELQRADQIIADSYNQKRFIPKFIQVKNFLSNDKPVIIDHLKGFNAKLFPKNALSFEFDYYIISKNLLFFSSWYSDKIYVYDLIKKQILTELTIQSDYTKIGDKPLIISPDNVEQISDKVKESGSFKGQISRFYYDAQKNLLYVLVYHEQKNLRSQFHGVIRDWSLIVYKDLNKKIYEKKFSHGSHSIGFSMLSNSGLWIQKAGKGIPENQLIFDCFTPVFNN